MIGCVRFKDGVRLDQMTPALARIIAALDIAARWKSQDLTVTCGREGHPASDPHTAGRAVDVRTRDLSPDDTVKLYTYLQSLLGDSFRVLYESPIPPNYIALKRIAYVNAGATAPHFHIQVAKDLAEYPPKDPPSVNA